MLFPKAPAFGCKKAFELIFTALYFYIYELKKCVSDFENLISNWRYYYFCPLWRLFSRYVQLKSSFSDKKISAVKSETHFSREAIEN